MNADFLPYGRHWIDEEDVSAVAACLRGDWLTTGPAVTAFEQAFADTVGARFAVACANGTAALHLAALAASVSRGDTCVAPTMSFIASANGMRYAGADIIFADADPQSGLITPDTFRAAISRAGRPIKMAVVVHLNGYPVRMDEISRIAEANDILLVEDACHALGGSYVDADGACVMIGSSRQSAMTVFSLHPVKTITMGEGGVVTTNDQHLYERLQLLRGHGIVRDSSRFVCEELAFASNGEAQPWFYEMQELGYNYRASDIACVLAHSQLKKLPMFAQRRARIKAIYDKHFSVGRTDFRPVAAPISDETSVLHLYPVLIDFAAFGKERSTVMAELRERGIGTQVHYIPIHRQPYYKAASGSTGLAGADAYYRQTLSLPFYPLMEEADAYRVVEGVRSVLGLDS